MATLIGTKKRKLNVAKLMTYVIHSASVLVNFHVLQNLITSGSEINYKTIGYMLISVLSYIPMLGICVALGCLHFLHLSYTNMMVFMVILPTALWLIHGFVNQNQLLKK
ncbi:hypothetical protein LDJ79_00330 [Vibrio tritonius]|uniref:Uncharacterized protein n=1 Tax=Vibrio tritonius TaxID=1435069 RepID=A0ABS7YFT4_9VIBR|nr:hypothetical protein [Vibrio tritonius]MCA2014534.1 hypothetical protein [Vibrio tritonius]